jgi:plastocyanin
MQPKPQLRKGLKSGKADIMKKNLLIMLVSVAALSLAASAGTLSGSVKGAPGQSVVYLQALQGSASAPASQQVYKMDQKGMKFIPNILVVPVGATVEFDNEDAAAHNVYWPGVSGDKKLKHNLGTFPTGQKATYKFEHAGVVPVLCNIHPEMSAYIIVTPTPYYAQTDQILGDYFIQNVPDGQYKAFVWHNGKTTSQLVKVAGNTKVDFTLGK